MKLDIPKYILDLPAYVPGKPIEEVEREYGIHDSVKLASNENPLGPSPKAMSAVQAALSKAHRYPDAGGYELVRALAEKLDVPAENIVLGNGSDDIIAMLGLALLRPGDAVAIPRPSFQMYEIMVRSSGAHPVWVPLKDFATDIEGMAAAANSGVRMVFITNPHNPTGTVLTRQSFEAFLDAVPADVVVVLDEAYIEFARSTDCPQSFSYLDRGRPVVGLRTFSKAFGLAGLRVGYGLMPPDLAEVLNRVRQPFNVNTLALTAARAALGDTEFLKRTLDLVHEGIDSLSRQLEDRGLPCQPSQANFLLVELGPDAPDMVTRLLRQGVIVRGLTSYGYPMHIRVNVGLPEENEKFIQALDEVLAEFRTSGHHSA
jgi:histidinol-phosphate aminotransferase